MFSHEQWFEKYLPPGVHAEDLGEKDITALIEVFTQAEIEAENFFKKRVATLFYETLKGSIASEIEPLLPKNPVPVEWTQLTPTQQDEVKKIYFEDSKKTITPKTIRKHIRKYLTPLLGLGPE